MKKFFTLLFVLSLFLLVGCDDKTLTLKEGTYYDKNNMHNGSSLERITLKENNAAERITCGADAGCSLFKGFYSVKDTTLTLTLTHYSDEIEGWTDLEEDEKIEYTITNNNEFKKDKSEFVLETEKKEEVVTKYDVKLENQNEKFDFDKLHLEFTGSEYSECEKCYFYMLNIKYDGKEVENNYFKDDEYYRISSSNMAASFTVYKIDEVYILVSNFGSQCYPNNILFFNTSGETLKIFSAADINISNRNIEIEISKGSCMEEGTKYNYEISGSELKEK